ncbi:MAG TPA: pyruvate formate lyase family protein [Chthonomonadales bacterium]|nr:pyruvate formate lyase family protein [Chthonomonadales bacterium]
MPDRREFLKQSAAAVAAAALAARAGADGVAPASPDPQEACGALAAPRRRLSDAVHALTERAMRGEFGRAAVPAPYRLSDRVDTRRMSEDMKGAHAVRLAAETAPLRIEPEELIVGSATFREAIEHRVPFHDVTSVSHTTLGFDKALRIGYRGLRSEITERVARGGLDAKGLELLDGMRMCIDAAGVWHGRHVEALRQRMAGETGEQRARTARVLAALERVPENPPATFHEAVQALWFLFAFQRLCGTWSGLGRVDQMLGPFLARDLAAARITLDEARELLAHFWAKGVEWCLGPVNRGSGDGQHYQNVILAGSDEDGREVTNEVTYLILDVVEELRISDYPIAVRLHRGTPERLLRRVAEVQRRGGGIVALYNEETVIRAMTRFGYPLREARSFANDGCWEVLVPGKTTFSYVPFDALIPLQQTLQLTADGPASPPEYATFEELYGAYRVALDSQVDGVQRMADGWAASGHACPLVSLMVEDCIERGRGYFERGSHYTVLSPHAGGIANVADSLLVIRTLVYEQRSISLAGLVEALRADWAGHEPLRKQIATRLAFYGNDDERADAMAKRVFDDYVTIVEKVRERDGVQRPAGISTFGRQIEWTAHRLATADGHRKGEYLASNLSPTPGADRRGPSAAIRSYCALDLERLPNGGTLELKIVPQSVRGERGVRALVGLMRTFVELGGYFMHVDVVDTDLLLDAQRHPDRYPGLAVRTAGWSARFATLDRSWQDMVIRRTQQTVA